MAFYSISVASLSKKLLFDSDSWGPYLLKSGIICVTKIVFEYLLSKMIANTFFTTHRQCTGLYVSFAMSTTAG